MQVPHEWLPLPTFWVRLSTWRRRSCCCRYGATNPCVSGIWRGLPRVWLAAAAAAAAACRCLVICQLRVRCTQVNKVPPTMTAEQLHLLLERPGVAVSHTTGVAVLSCLVWLTSACPILTMQAPQTKTRISCAEIPISHLRA